MREVKEKEKLEKSNWRSTFMLVTLTKYFERIHASKQAIRELDGIIRDRPDATTTAGKEKRRTTTVTTTTTTTTTSVLLYY